MNNLAHESVHIRDSWRSVRETLMAKYKENKTLIKNKKNILPKSYSNVCC